MNRHATADADINAEARHASLHSFDVDNLDALENTDRCRFVHLADQAAQDRPRLRAQIGAANGIEAQIQAFERQTEFARVLDLLDVAQHDQRVEQPERGCVVEVCATRDFGEYELRLVARKGLEHAKALRQGIDDILVGEVGHLFGMRTLIRYTNENYAEIGFPSRATPDGRRSSLSSVEAPVCEPSYPRLRRDVDES